MFERYAREGKSRIGRVQPSNAEHCPHGTVLIIFDYFGFLGRVLIIVTYPSYLFDIVQIPAFCKMNF